MPSYAWGRSSQLSHLDQSSLRPERDVVPPVATPTNSNRFGAQEKEAYAAANVPRTEEASFLSDLSGEEEASEDSLTQYS